jgi:outer membrane protein OmpA-like peptidoglycan-associated protein
MKNIKFIFVALVAMFVTLGSTSVYAQEDGNRDANGYVVKGPYLTNGGGANWFVGVGGGFNTAIGKEIKPFAEFTPKNNWAAEAFIGKWFTPTIGARVGYKGVMNNFAYDADTYVSNAYGNGEQVRFGYAHADLMWNLSNALSGYKETRFWDVIPYAGFGYLGINNGQTDNKIGVSAGVYNELRLGKVVNLFIDLGVIGTENPVGLRTVADNAPVVTDETNVFVRPLYMPTATVGITFNLSKKKNFDRFSSVGVRKDVYDALKAQYDALVARGPEVKEVVKEVPVTKEVQVEKEVQVLVGSTVITFPIGSSTLSTVEREKVEMFAKAFDGQDVVVKVVGSADSKTGTAKRNNQLAQKRADVVKGVLVKNGIPEDKIIVETTLDATENAETSRSAIITLEQEKK